MRTALRRALAVAAVWLAVTCPALSAAERPPNVVFFLIDDLGWTDLGCFGPYRIPTLKDGPAGEYLTDRLAAEAVRFIEANRVRPFFLYFPHYAVHTPLQAKKELVEKFRQKVRPGLRHTNATYAAMIA